VICALNELNINYEITLTDFPSAQLGTQTGVYDGFFVASANGARAKYSKPSAPIIFNNLAWYMPLKSKIDPNDPADALELLPGCAEYIFADGGAIGGDC
jgi:hypothetical protein